MPRRTKKQLESEFQADLICEIEAYLPGAVVMKQDPNYRQGVPDLLILNEDKWATLEVKASAKAEHQPNQDYWVERMNSMSFSAFVHPENKDAVLRELLPHLGLSGVTLIRRTA